MKSIAVFLLSMLFTIGLFAQVKPAAKKSTAKTSKTKASSKGKKSTKSKKLKTTGETEFEEVVCFEDGPCTFTIIRRDTLVYEVNASGKQYSLFVIPNKFDANTIADFNWITTGPESKSGHVVVNSQGLNTGKKYMLNLPAGELKLTDASSVWLSNINFKEIAKGETNLSMDNDQTETYKSPEADAVTTQINYKGKPLNLEGFTIQNKPEGEPGRKEVWILNISNNLLIIKLDNNSWSMQLKEVRERKQ